MSAPTRLDPTDRRILRLALPALGALAIEPLYVLVDTAVVGRIGTDELAGLALAAAILSLVFAGSNFLAYGTT
ncbi:MAG: MATE family efflux transporter, partial [Ilumatobacteraceae bacterium]